MGISISYHSDRFLEPDVAALFAAMNHFPDSVDPLERLAAVRVLEGVRPVPAQELFTFSKFDSDRFDFLLTGDWSRVRHVGAGIRTGWILVESSVGDAAGRAMQGGRLQILGNAGDDVGQGMTGGTISVFGDAGHRLAGPMPGKRFGCNRGVVFVAGSTGDCAAHAMRRGTIVIGGNCGRMAGYELRGGNLVVAGRAGPLPGAGMRRGLILLLQRDGNLEMPSGFDFSGRTSPVFARLLARSLPAQVAAEIPMFPTEFEAWSGDRLYGKKGELMMSAGDQSP